MIHPARIFLISGLSILGFSAYAEPIFRWVDDQGVVWCTGDPKDIPSGRQPVLGESATGCITPIETSAQAPTHAEVPFHAYRWVDDQGVTNYTDSPENIPTKYKVEITFGAEIGRDVSPKAEPKS
jgi:Domain of unknown function (DUF4124)